MTCRFVTLSALLAAIFAVSAAEAAELPDSATRRGSTPIQHVIIIVQENRSFDHYFGTYPGANGFPAGTCVPLSLQNPGAGCVKPFHDEHDLNAGGPHGAIDAMIQMDNGVATNKMDGFVDAQTQGFQHTCGEVSVGRTAKRNCNAYVPGTNRHDTMGYHDASDIPNYWAYAQNFVLQDSLFEPVRGWSLAAHLYLASEWAAHCKTPTVVSTCASSPISDQPKPGKVTYPWLNLFQLLDMNNVSWKWYLGYGTEPDCEDDQMTCDPQIQTNGTLSIWNPAPGFASVAAQGSAYLKQHNPALDQFLVDLKSGSLPAVSWLMPAAAYSEHPASGVTIGEEYVTSIVNAVMQSQYWQSTAIFLTWDDWGGFYEHAVPPVVDTNNTTTPVQGYGMRVPGLLISAWAKPGFIDHSVLSFDAYATLFEDLFVNSTRLDPKKLGFPDARPTVRDALTQVTFPNGSTAPIGKLVDEFDFTQKPLPPLVLSTHIPTNPIVSCGSKDPANPQLCANQQVKITWTPVAAGKVPGPFTYQLLRDGTAVESCHTTSASCFDLRPPSGVHIYRLYSIDQNGVASPNSGGVEADVP